MLRLNARPAQARGREIMTGGARPNDRRGIQLGPRIRIGGSLGALGQKAKVGTGKVLSNKIVQGVIGATAGPWAAAAAGAAGKALDTSRGRVGIGDLAKGGVTGGISGLAGMGVKNAVGSIARHGVKGAVGSGLSTAKRLVSGGGSDGTGRFGMAGDLVGRFGGGDDDGGRSSVLDALLLGGGIAASAADRKRQQDMQNRAAKYATDSYDSRAGLREKGLQMAMDDSTQDLSSLFADPGNPYDRQRRQPARPVSPMKSLATSMGREGEAVGPKVPVRRLSY